MKRMNERKTNLFSKMIFLFEVFVRILFVEIVSVNRVPVHIIHRVLANQQPVQ